MQNFVKTIVSKPYHVGTHLKALADYSQMNTHLPGFQSFFNLFALFCIGKFATSSERVKEPWGMSQTRNCSMVFSWLRETCFQTTMRGDKDKC